MGTRKPCLFRHVPTLPVDRDKNFRPDPIIQRSQLWLPWMSRHMHMRLLFRDGQNVALSQLVHDDANGNFVARYLFR